MKNVIDYIQDEDPSFDPARYACEKAGVPYDTYCAAFDRVYIDGYYGPIADSDWRHEDGREPSNVNAALDILAKVSDEILDYKELAYYIDEDGFEYEEEEVTCEADEIRRALFAPVISIYGHLPW